MASYNFQAYKYDTENDIILEDEMEAHWSEYEDKNLIPMLCCKKELNDCICDDPVDFFSALDWVSASLLTLQPDEVAYASTEGNLLVASCESCINYMSPDCPDFLDWTSDIYTQVELGKSEYVKEDFIEIYPCNLYNPHEDATDAEIDQALQFTSVINIEY